MMRIGIDFDNTIIDYGTLFCDVARQLGSLPPDVQDKTRIRDYLKSIDRHELWIEIQGRVYGERIRNAQPFPGFAQFLARCREKGVETVIVSHKTRYAKVGPRHDLQAAAREWIDRHVGTIEAHFCETRAEKLATIASLGCTHFIDDLPAVFAEPGFPAGVERVLFDPDELDWPIITQLLLPAAPNEAAAVLLGHGNFELEPFACAGGNNRIRRVRTTERELILKQYFCHRDDRRDRLDPEFGFLTHLWDHDIRNVPEPVACSQELNAALYSFVEGERPEPSAERVMACATFIREINRFREDADLPAASESCLSFEAHLNAVNRRIAALEAMKPCDELTAQAKAFVQQDVVPAWHRVQERIDRSLHFDVLPREQWRLSPSDFGFHNALVRPDGELVFLDFEYAGWDDPAKLICDFACHAGHELPASSFERFAEGVVAVGELERVRDLLPVHQMKWVCLLLNEFLPVAGKRRDYAGSDTKRRAQLARARERLDLFAPLS